MRKWLLSGVMICWLTLGWTVISAQQPTWTAWLYDRETGRVQLVNETGAVQQEVALPTLTGFDIYSYNIAVSHNGRYIAYRLNQANSRIAQLVIYDTDFGGIIAQYFPGAILADSLDFTSESRSFNDANTSFIYTFVTEREAFEIVLIDLAAGVANFRLTTEDALVRQANIRTDYLPVIQRYVGTEFAFSMTNFATQAIPDETSYRFNPGSLLPESSYPTVQSGTFKPTGEAVFAVQDIRFANRLETLERPRHLNTLQVFDPRTGERFPVFQRESWSMGNAFFVNGGRQVLFNAFDLDNETNLWGLIDRSVQVVNIAPVDPLEQQVIGMSDGFLHLFDNGASAELRYARIENNVVVEDRIIWAAEAGRYPRLVWAQDSRQATNVQLPAWERLATAVTSTPFVSTPVFDGGGISPGAIATVTPLVAQPPLIVTATPLLGLPTSPPSDVIVVTATPSSRVQPGALVIGSAAFINTTEGDRLNLRSGAGISFDVVAQVDDGTQVVLLEGPIPADGFTWWRVRLSDGRSGWVVQRADNVDTLVPASQ